MRATTTLHEHNAKKPEKKSKEESTKTFSKSRIIEGIQQTSPTPKPMYEDVPENHLFILPPELRNRIYEDVLDTETTEVKDDDPLSDQRSVTHSPKLRTIRSGNTDEPALLWVCHQMREECLSMYYSKSKFELRASPEKLVHVRRWLSAVKEKHGCEANDFSPILEIRLRVNPFRWTDLRHLETVAYIVSENYYAWDRISWGPRDTVRRPENLAHVVKEAAELGKKAFEQDWNETELEQQFGDWLLAKYDEVPDVSNDAPVHYSRPNANAQTSDRVLRPRKVKPPDPLEPPEPSKLSAKDQEMVAVKKKKRMAKRSAALGWTEERLPLNKPVKKRGRSINAKA